MLLLIPCFSKHLQGVHFKPFECRSCLQRFGRPNERDRHERDDVCSRQRVPDYLNGFCQKVCKSADQNELDEILYPGGVKQYDVLDGTDGRCAILLLGDY